MRKGILFMTLFVATVFTLTACRANEAVFRKTEDGKQIIKIGYLPITHAAPLFIENELDDDQFEHVKLELVKFGSWPELLDALNTGRIDGASVLIELAMAAKEQGIDLKAVALGHRDGNAVVVSDDIKSAKDLKGKNFAIPHRLSTHNVLLYEMLKKEQLKYDDVNIIELPPSEMPAALSEGRIHGYVVAEPFGALSVAINKGKVLYQSEDLWVDSLCCAIVLRSELIEHDRDAVQEFMTQYVKAGEQAQMKNEQTYEILTKYMNVEKKVMDLSLQWIAYLNLRLNAKEYEQLRQYVIEMKLSENPPKYQDFVDSSFIDQVK